MGIPQDPPYPMPTPPFPLPDPDAPPDSDPKSDPLPSMARDLERPKPGDVFSRDGLTRRLVKRDRERLLVSGGMLMPGGRLFRPGVTRFTEDRRRMQGQGQGRRRRTHSARLCRSSFERDLDPKRERDRTARRSAESPHTRHQQSIRRPAA
jgi:hypothetical protein